MDNSVLVTVPEEFGQALIDDGFEEFETVRSVDAETVTTMVCTAVGLVANVVIILGGRADIAAFARKLRGWLGRRADAAQGSEFVLDAVYRNGAEHTEIRIVSRRADAEQPSRIDTTALENLLSGMLAEQKPAQRG